MDKYLEKRKNMIESQLKARGISNQKILESFLQIPRENFVPENIQNISYQDTPLPIGYGQTISQPYIVALMSELINPQKDDYILEIGTGSGYQSAILSKLIKKILSFEIIPELATFAQNNLKNTQIKNVIVINTDGTEELGKEFQFDKIIVTAATKKISKNWIKSLKENGTIVLPQGNNLIIQYLLKYKKINGKLKLLTKSIPVTFVPLTGKYGFNS